ncbi:hypothetical protein DFH09DRAFT_629737 [Mycena vulgaris]|nr:hypothetical protein DFH09DRAFT_629737 [Mycena vulgaris]
MLPSSLPVQELWDHIIDQVVSEADLASFSLVSRSFVSRAQSHIFRAIILGPEQGIAVNRLAGILSSSTHLIQYICFFYLGSCDAELLSPLARLTWSHVHTMTFSHSGEPSQPSAFEEIHLLVATPSLRNLTIHGEGWQTEQLVQLFAHCTEGLDRINFFGISSTLAPCPSVTIPPAPCPQIHQLSLMYAHTIPDILANPACGLDFSALTRVLCLRSMGPALQSILLQARLTIDSLHFGGTDETIESLDLGVFPALKYIKCDDTGDTLIRMLKSLPPTNVVDRIRLALIGDDVGLVDLRGFETTILAVKMAKLQHAEVEVVHSFSVMDEEEMAATVKADLPLLHEKGLLFVHFS